MCVLSERLVPALRNIAPSEHMCLHIRMLAHKAGSVRLMHEQSFIAFTHLRAERLLPFQRGFASCFMVCVCVCGEKRAAIFKYLSMTATKLCGMNEAVRFGGLRQYVF